jgi:hypothetical protein
MPGPRRYRENGFRGYFLAFDLVMEATATTAATPYGTTLRAANSEILSFLGWWRFLGMWQDFISRLASQCPAEFLPAEAKLSATYANFP